MNSKQDNMERPDNLKQVSLGINASCFGILIVIFCAFYWGIYAQLDAREKRLHSKKNVLANFLETEAEIVLSNRLIKKRFDEQQGRLAELIERIPNTPHESNFLEQLTSVAESAEFDIRDFNPGNTHIRGKHSQLEIDLVGRASYEGICRFLDGLARLPRLCQITSFQIISPSKATSVYRVEAKIRIFFAPSMASCSPKDEVSHVG